VLSGEFAGCDFIPPWRFEKQIAGATVFPILTLTKFAARQAKLSLT